MDKYGNTTTGWLLYKKYDPQVIKASNEVFLDTDFVKSYSNNLCHVWMSMEGQAESYNQTWLGSKKVGFIKKFLDLNPAVGRHFDKMQMLSFKKAFILNTFQNNILGIVNACKPRQLRCCIGSILLVFG